MEAALGEEEDGGCGAYNLTPAAFASAPSANVAPHWPALWEDVLASNSLTSPSRLFVAVAT